MEKGIATHLFTNEEQRQLTWLQLSLTLSVIGEFVLLPPGSYVASAIMLGFPLVLWITSASGSATKSCAGRHLIFVLVNYILYPILIFFFISSMATRSAGAGAELLELMPDNELSFIYVLASMVQGMPATMGAERFLASIALFVLIVIYARVIFLPLLNIYYLRQQKTLLYPITL